MARRDDLAEFVRAGLAAGQGRDALAAALSAAGWSGREVAAALEGWADGGAGLPPVPRPQPYASARDALTFGLLFLLLGWICFHLVMIGFALLDTLLPDAADYYDPPRSSLRWSVATLIPTVPLFLWLTRRVAAATRGDAGRRRSLVRKWLASVTLLVAALTLLGDGVAVIYAALNGDLTARFAAKAALIAVVGAIALAYYRDEIDG